MVTNISPHPHPVNTGLVTPKIQNKCYARHGICPRVGIWKIRFREKWNMVKIDEPQ
jgi:hypothetical protein